MGDNGARNLILISRSTKRSDEAKELLEELKSRDITVLSPACDIADAAKLSRILQDCSTKLPPIKGCIQATLQLNVEYLFEIIESQH